MRMRSRLATALIVLAFGIVVPARGGRHPVPLEPDIDPAKCVECHEDKTKGKSVHTAIAMGCTSCHEIRVIKSKDKKKEDITRVKLIKATAQSQCLSCHDALKGSAGNSKPHAPVTRNCLTCHDAHVAENKFQLKLALDGSGSKNLCITCHSNAGRMPPKGSRHAALDMGCNTCHLTHKTGSADKRDNRFHLVKDAPALCVDCHDPKEKAISAAHHDQPIATADCLSCHDAHQSSKPKLAQRFQHAPFEAGACDSCHAAPKDGKVVLTQTDTRALCITCHEEQAKQIETAKVQHAGAQGECIACHSPHGSAYDRLMKPDPVTACENCHADQAEMHKKKAVLHKAAFRDGCYTCHNGHGGTREKLLRARDNALCLECHSPRRRPKLDEENGTANIFSNTVRLPGYYFGLLPALDLRAGDAIGHPTANHPVEATIDRSDPAKKRSMTCLSCHATHGSDSSGMLANEGGTRMDLCNKCHTPSSLGVGVPLSGEGR